MINLRIPTQKEFEEIVILIKEYELDNRGLLQNQFIAAFTENKLVGFGRIRVHSDCNEICSIGTLPTFRNRGICKMIIEDLIKKCDQAIYIVCIIPNYFKPFGFEIVDSFPEAILDKLNYCTKELVVPEKYFVMQKN